MQLQTQNLEDFKNELIQKYSDDKIMSILIIRLSLETTLYHDITGIDYTDFVDN